MKVVHRSMNLKAHRQLKYLLAVTFLVAIAFGSDEVERSSRQTQTGGYVRYAEFTKLKNEVDALRAAASRPPVLTSGQTTTGGAVYIRWGRNVCGHGSEVLYKGVAGGSSWDNTGGGSNYLCLSQQPTYGAYNAFVEKASKLFGSEYEYPTGFRLINNNHLPLHDNNVPCVVCRSQTKSSVVMIPGKNLCFPGLHTEYTGFLMSGHSMHKGRTEFVCMDGEPETVPYGFANENGAMFFNVEGVCGSLPCPPYIARREITCAVCTK